MYGSLKARLRWRRFSLRSMFVALTLIGCWLGWNVPQIRERRQLLDSLRAREAVIREGDPLVGRPLPLSWRLLGAQPVYYIELKLSRTSEDDFRAIDRLVPETAIGLGGGGGPRQLRDAEF